MPQRAAFALSYRNFLITWALTVAAAAVAGGVIFGRFGHVFLTSPYAALLYPAVWILPAVVPLVAARFIARAHLTVSQWSIAYALTFLAFNATFRMLMLFVGALPGLIARYGGNLPAGSFLISFPLIVFASGIASAVAQFMCDMYGGVAGAIWPRRELVFLILSLAASWVGVGFLVYDHVGVIGAARSVGGPAAEIAVFMTVTGILLIGVGLVSMAAIGQYLGRDAPAGVGGHSA